LPEKVHNAQMWRTPNSWDAKRGPLSQELYEDSLKNGTHQINLITQVVRKFPTPTVIDSKGMKKHGSGSMTLNGTVLDEEESSDGLPIPGPTGQLNPIWVEGLMGFPFGWTDISEGD
jgi:hypothetical protein